MKKNKLRKKVFFKLKPLSQELKAVIRNMPLKIVSCGGVPPLFKRNKA